MKKEISVPIAVVAVLVLIIGGWFVFQKATGPVGSEKPSPDVTKMTTQEIETIKQGSRPDNVH
ncbi:hypothetical protein EON81_26490 [bacterium]|nr:MAG: hypothetical protein EON81_26490 [bacterium]